MSENLYRIQLDDSRTQKIRNILKELPQSCSDFIVSIGMTTSTLTRLAYTIDLQTFCNYVYTEIPRFSNRLPYQWTDQDISSLTAKDLNRYAEYLTLYIKNQDEKPDNQRILRNHESGVMRKLSALRSYFEFMFKNERLPANIASLVSLPKLHDKPILHLVGSEVEKLLHVAAEAHNMTETQKKFHEHTHKRDYAILMLFLGTGMRVSECVGVNISDLDLNLNGVLVTRKGGNQVILYYPDEVAAALKDYLGERKTIAVKDPADADALFLSLQKKRITQRAVEQMVKKYCNIAVPLKKKMSPHKLRSTYATNLYGETGDIYLVADALGHSSVNTTRKHYAAMSEERRKEAASNVHLPKANQQTE